jgi:hypothetical protein
MADARCNPYGIHLIILFIINMIENNSYRKSSLLSITIRLYYCHASNNKCFVAISKHIIGREHVYINRHFKV